MARPATLHGSNTYVYLQHTLCSLYKQRMCHSPVVASMYMVWITPRASGIPQR